jgi:hypothetical protein
MMSLPNDSAYKAKIFTPAFRRPAVKECFKGDLKVGIKAIVAKQSMISGSGRTTCVGLSLNCSEEAQKVHKHYTVHKFRLVVKAINLMTVLRTAAKGMI